MPIAGIFRLLLAHHVNHFDPAEDNAGRGDRLEAEHGSNPPLDRTVVLFGSIVEVAALPDPDRLELPSGLVLELVFRIAGQNGLAVAVDELEALANKELESGLNAVWRSRDLAGRRRRRIEMFVLRCRLRGEPYPRIIAD